MQRTILKFLVPLVTLVSLSAWAQGPQQPDAASMIQRRVNFLTNHLGLSSAQQQQATTIFTNAMNGMQSFHEQMRSARQALQAAVQKGDSAAIDQAAGTIGNLTAQQTAAHAKADAQFFQILSSDQQAKFQQIEEHGPGGEFRGHFGRRE